MASFDCFAFTGIAVVVMAVPVSSRGGGRVAMSVSDSVAMSVDGGRLGCPSVARTNISGRLTANSIFKGGARVVFLADLLPMTPTMTHTRPFEDPLKDQQTTTK